LPLPSKFSRIVFTDHSVSCSDIRRLSRRRDWGSRNPGRFPRCGFRVPFRHMITQFSHVDCNDKLPALSVGWRTETGYPWRIPRAARLPDSLL